MGSLKFISYIGTDGVPELVPVVQCQAADSRRLAFAPLAFGRELRRIPSGTEVAVFCLTMGMEDVLIRGTFRGFKRHRLITLGTVDIEWVYNSMPPAHGAIIAGHAHPVAFTLLARVRRADSEHRRSDARLERLPQRR